MLTFPHIFLGAVHTVAGAFLLSWLWSLFAVPLGAPVIGALHAWGLGLLVAHATGVVGKAIKNAAAELELTDAQKEDRKTKLVAAQVGALLLYPVVVAVVSAVMAIGGPL